MTGINAVGAAGGANPLAGFSGQVNGTQGALSGLGDSGAGGAGTSGAPNQVATAAQGSSFGDTLRAMVVDNPTADRAQALDLSARFAAGDTSIDPHKVAIASAKAGVEIQMATRTISSAVQAVRTLFQMQV